MTERNVENRARILLDDVDTRIQQALGGVKLASKHLDPCNGRDFPDRAANLRREVGDLADLLVMEHTLRAVLGLGDGFIKTLSTGEEIHFPVHNNLTGKASEG